MSRNKLILIVLGLGAVAYFLFKKKKAQPNVTGNVEPSPEPPPEPLPDWIDTPTTQAIFDHDYTEDELLDGQCPPHSFIEGCLHPDALNYNPCATFGSVQNNCEFPAGTVIGCGDSTKCNYDPNVTVNVPSMCYTEDFCQNFYSGNNNSVTYRGSQHKNGLHPLY